MTVNQALELLHAKHLTSEVIETLVECPRFQTQAKKYEALSDDATGLDGIGKASCVVNGWDTAKEYTDTTSELYNKLSYYFTIRTAIANELI